MRWPQRIILTLLSTTALLTCRCLGADEPTEILGDPEFLERWRQLIEERVPDTGWSSRLRATDLTGVDGARTYGRWSVTSENWVASLVAERDPGEKRWTDHLAGYVQWRRGPLQVVGGSIRPGFAQGLLFGRGSGRGRGRGRQEARAFGFHSSSENQALRGIALKVGDRWQTAVVLADFRRDARLDAESNVKSLPEDGLHTGPTAINGRMQLSGGVLGLRLRHLHETGHLGIVVQNLWFDQRLKIPTRYGDDLFVGRDQMAAAMDGQWQVGQAQMYSQVAVTSARSTTWGGVAGFTNLGPRRARVSLQARLYEFGFFSPFGSSDRRWKTSNERGLYVDLRGRRWRGWYDQSIRPEPESMPISDESMELGFEGRWRRESTQLRLDLRRRADAEWAAGQKQIIRSARARLQGTVTNQPYRFRALLQGHLVDDERGRSVGLDGRRRTQTHQIQLQFTWFNVSAWKARIYEYESTLPGAVAILPLAGRGARLNGSLRLELCGFGVAMFARRQWRRRVPTRTRIGVQIDRSSGI